MKIKLHFCCVFFLPLFGVAQAPDIQWQKSYGGTLSEYSRKMKATSDGGYIYIGAAQSSDGDLTVNHGDLDLWVVKTDADGNLQWQKSYGGSGLELSGDIVQTGDGYAFAATTYSNDGDVGGHHGINGDMWLVKIDDAGQIQWQNCLGGTNHEVANSLITTTDGGFLVVGSKTLPIMIGETATSTDEFFIVKTDSQGSEQWNKVYGGTYDEIAYDVVQNDDGTYVVAGETASSDGDVANNHATGSFLGDFWILKLAADGEIVWQKSLGGTHYEIPFKIIKTDGGYVVVGNTNSNDGDVTNYHNLDDGWVVKIDQTGEILWQKTLGGGGQDYLFGVVESENGFIVSGESNSVDGDIIGNHGGYDAWAVKLDASGNLVWQKMLGGSAKDNVFGIVKAPDQGVVFAGYSASINGDLTENNGGWDMWTLKLVPEVLSVNDSQTALFTVHPNPALSAIALSQPVDQIAIFDISGKQVCAQSGGLFTVNVENLAPGYYILQAETQNARFQTKFVKQ